MRLKVSDGFRYRVQEAQDNRIRPYFFQPEPAGSLAINISSSIMIIFIFLDIKAYRKIFIILFQVDEFPRKQKITFRQIG